MHRPGLLVTTNKPFPCYDSDDDLFVSRVVALENPEVRKEIHFLGQLPTMDHNSQPKTHNETDWVDHVRVAHLYPTGSTSTVVL